MKNLFFIVRFLLVSLCLIVVSYGKVPTRKKTSINKQEKGFTVKTGMRDPKLKNNPPILPTTQGSREIIDSEGRPTSNFLELLALFGVQHDGTLLNINEKLQKEWRRTPYLERWQLQDTYSASQREKALVLINNFGYFDEVAPVKKDFDYALLLGATVMRVRHRLSYLVTQWNNGIRFKTLVLLSGDRDLDPVIEAPAELLNKDNKFIQFRDDWKLQETLPTSETGMMHLVYEQSAIPQEMRNSIKLVEVAAPKITLLDGKKIRPSLNDTIVAWLATKPSAGTCIAISNQPYVTPQSLVLKRLLPQEFPVETVGGGSNINQDTTPVLLDMIASILYHKIKLREKEHTNITAQQKSP